MFFNANLGVSTLKDYNLSIDELVVLSIVWNCERDNKACYYKRDTIAKHLNCSEAKVERLYKSLKDKNMIFISGKIKKLTQKGITFCMGVMYYKMSERQKKKVRHPKWLKEMLDNEQAKKDRDAKRAFTVAKSEEELAKQVKDVFGENAKISKM